MGIDKADRHALIMVALVLAIAPLTAAYLGLAVRIFGGVSGLY